MPNASPKLAFGGLYVILDLDDDDVDDDERTCGLCDGPERDSQSGELVPNRATDDPTLYGEACHVACIALDLTARRLTADAAAVIERRAS